MARFWPILLLLVSTFADEQPRAMRTIAKGGFSGIQEPIQLVVTNATQWKEIWQKHSAREKPLKAPLEFDFEKETLLFVSLGKKPTGGHSVQITDFRQSDEKAEVTVQVRGPKPGAIQLQALTAPFHIVAVPKVTGPVKFTIDSDKAKAR
jgi:hypothetical protein